jgi:hypothetical protein
MLLIYHADCFDGFTAAWAYWHYGSPLGEAENYPAKYGTEPPYDLAKDHDVLMVDFSYPRPQLEKLDRFVDLCFHGQAIIDYQHQYGTKALAEAREEMIGGHLVPTVNLPYMNCSEYVGRLLQESPAHVPFAAGYFRRADGLWQFSLRARPNFKVNDLAKRFGGGGHPQAAGFQVAKLEDVFAPSYNVAKLP